VHAEADASPRCDISATQSAYAGIAAMTIDDSIKRLAWQMLHDLCKKCLAQVHASHQTNLAASQMCKLTFKSWTPHGTIETPIVIGSQVFG
jgi:hypothetical protein